MPPPRQMGLQHPVLTAYGQPTILLLIQRASMT